MPGLFGSPLCLLKGPLRAARKIVEAMASEARARSFLRWLLHFLGVSVGPLLCSWVRGLVPDFAVASVRGAVRALCFSIWKYIFAQSIHIGFDQAQKKKSWLVAWKARRVQEPNMLDRFELARLNCDRFQ